MTPHILNARSSGLKGQVWYQSGCAVAKSLIAATHVCVGQIRGRKETEIKKIRTCRSIIPRFIPYIIRKPPARSSSRKVQHQIKRCPKDYSIKRKKTANVDQNATWTSAAWLCCTHCHPLEPLMQSVAPLVGTYSVLPNLPGQYAPCASVLDWQGEGVPQFESGRNSIHGLPSTWLSCRIPLLFLHTVDNSVMSRFRSRVYSFYFCFCHILLTYLT